MKQMHVIFLKDIGTHKRVAIREEITKQIVSQYAGEVTEINKRWERTLGKVVFVNLLWRLGFAVSCNFK